MNPAGFKWGQTASTVTVTFAVPPGVSKNQVDVSITSSTLVAGIKSQPPVLSVRRRLRSLCGIAPTTVSLCAHSSFRREHYSIM